MKYTITYDNNVDIKSSWSTAFIVQLVKTVESIPLQRRAISSISPTILTGRKEKIPLFSKKDTIV